MPLHPQAQAFIDPINAMAQTPLSELTPEMARQGSADAVPPPREPVAAVNDFDLPGGDAQPLRARAYTPRDAGAGPLPLVLFLHGGGWVTGDLDTHDAPCRALANASGCKVVALAYRLAPEHKFPAGLEDCDAALRWLVAHADELGLDASRIAVAGDSAGGNLAAALTLLARDRGGPRIAFQLLVYPVTHHAFDTPSYRDYAEGHLLTLEGMRWNWNHYLPDAAAGQDPLASPWLAPDLRGLPPALVITAECDPLRDESEAYAKRLADAGIAVEIKRYPGMLHAFFTLGHLFDDGRAAVAYAGGVTRRALAPAGLADACLAELLHLWHTTPEALRPPSVWIAQHQPIAEDDEEPATPVMRAWFLDEGAIRERPAIDYVRFRAIHEGHRWSSGTSAPAAKGVFNNRPHHTHSIGLAAFAAVAGADSVHVGYQWGGRFGRGALYDLAPGAGSLACIRNLWVS